MKKKMICIFFLFFAASSKFTAQDLNVIVRFAAAEKIVRHYLFSESGRFYLQGSPETSCFTYLADPKIYGDEGKIMLRARLRAKTGIETPLDCLGPSLDLQVLLSGEPYYRDGILGIGNLKIIEGTGSGVLNELISSVVLPGLAEYLVFEIKDYLVEILSRLNESSVFTIAYSLNVTNFQIMGDRISFTPRISLEIKE